MKVLSTLTFNYPNNVVEFYTYYHNKLLIRGIDGTTVPMLVAHKYNRSYFTSSDSNKAYYNYIIPSRAYKQYYLKKLISISSDRCSEYGNNDILLSMPYMFGEEMRHYDEHNVHNVLNTDSKLSKYKFIPKIHVSMVFSNKSLVKKYKKVVYTYLYLHLRDYLDIYNINFQHTTLHFDIYFVVNGLPEVLKLIFIEIDTLISYLENNANDSNYTEIALENYITDVTIDECNGLKRVRDNIKTYNDDPNSLSLKQAEKYGGLLRNKWGKHIPDSDMVEMSKFFTIYDKLVENYTGYSNNSIQTDPYYNASKGLVEDYSSIADRVLKIKEFYFEDHKILTDEATKIVVALYSMLKYEMDEIKQLVKIIHNGKVQIRIGEEQPHQLPENDQIFSELKDDIEDNLKLLVENIEEYDTSPTSTEILNMRSRYGNYKKGVFNLIPTGNIKLVYKEKIVQPIDKTDLYNSLDLIKESGKFSDRLTQEIVELCNNYDKSNQIDSIRLNSGLKDIIIPEIIENINKMIDLPDGESFNELQDQMIGLIGNINKKIMDSYVNTLNDKKSDIYNSLEAIDDVFNNIMDMKGGDK